MTFLSIEPFLPLSRLVLLDTLSSSSTVVLERMHAAEFATVVLERMHAAEFATMAEIMLLSIDTCTCLVPRLSSIVFWDHTTLHIAVASW